MGRTIFFLRRERERRAGPAAPPSNKALDKMTVKIPHPPVRLAPCLCLLRALYLVVIIPIPLRVTGMELQTRAGHEGRVITVDCCSWEKGTQVSAQKDPPTVNQQKDDSIHAFDLSSLFFPVFFGGVGWGGNGTPPISIREGVPNTRRPRRLPAWGAADELSGVPQSGAAYEGGQREHSSPL